MIAAPFDSSWLPAIWLVGRSVLDRVATVWKEKNSRTFQGLFMDLKLTFPDLFRRRFCQVTEVLVMTILESMQCFGIKRKPLGSTKKNKISNLTQQVMPANPL